MGCGHLPGAIRRRMDHPSYPFHDTCAGGLEAEEHLVQVSYANERFYGFGTQTLGEFHSCQASLGWCCVFNFQVSI